MTLAERRDLQRDLMNVIAVVVALIGVLTKSQRVALASCLVALLAVCLSIYWRLDGKTDE
jgi:disulfide bond formation protein DsbB